MKKYRIVPFILILLLVLTSLNANNYDGSKLVVAYIQPNGGSSYYGYAAFGHDIGDKYISEAQSSERARTKYTFDLTSIPSNATINSVYLNCVITNWGNNSYEFKITQISNQSTPQTIWSDIGSSTALFSDISYGSSGLNSGELTTLVNNNKASNLYLGAMSENENSLDSYANLSLTLSISYTVPPVTITADNNFIDNSGTGTHGTIVIDGTSRTIPSSGYSFLKNVGTNLSLSAVSPQTDNTGYQMVWHTGSSYESEWQRNNVYVTNNQTYNHTVSANDANATYKANLKQIRTTTTGTMSTSETWFTSVTLSGNVTVPSGVTLTIAADAIVYLGNYSLISTGGTISLDSEAEISPNKVLLNNYSLPEGIFPTIQLAVNYASSGDEIELFDETYSGDFGVSSKSYITIAGKLSGTTPSTVINGDVNIYNSDYCTLAYLHVNDVLEVSYSDHAELIMLDVDDGLEFSNSDYAELEDVENNSGNNSIGLLLFSSSVDGEENTMFQTSYCGLQCNGWSDAVLYGQLFCGNSNYDIRLDGPPLSTNSVALYQGDINNTPSFSSSTVGSRIYDPYNDVYWSSWNYCGVLSKVSHAEQTDAEYEPVNEVIFEDPAKEEYRKTLGDYLAFLRKLRSSEQENTEQDLNNKLVEFTDRFDEIVNTFSESPVAVKSLFHKAKILRQTGDKTAGEKYIDSKQNENSQFSNYISSHSLCFDIKDENYEKALKNIEDILKKITDPSEIAQLLYDKAMLYRFGLNDEIKSMEIFSEIVEKYPDSQIAKSALRQLKKKYQGKEDIAQNNVGDKISINNYPNPFNPTTKISFTLPVDGRVSLKIFDMLGREVADLANDVYTAGTHEVEFNATNLASGIYFYTIRTTQGNITKKMLLVK